MEEPKNSNKNPLYLFSFARNLPFRSFVIKVFQNFKSWCWKNPKKLTIYIVIFVLAFLSGLLVLFKSWYMSSTSHLQRTGDSKLVDGGIWEKMSIPERETPFFTLEPKTEFKNGISLKDTFVLKTQKPIDINFISTHLSSSVPVDIIPASDTQFELKPKRSFSPDEVVRFSLQIKDKEKDGYSFNRDYGWAYQAQPKFTVKNTLPHNQATGVPIDAGIEIVFSLDNYEDPKNYIVIDPKIEFNIERKGNTLVIVPIKKLLPKTVYRVTLRKGLKVISGADSLTEDLVFSFQTGGDIRENVSRFYLEGNFQHIIPEEEIISRVYVRYWDHNQKIKFEIYKMPSPGVFVESRKLVDNLEYWCDYFPEQYKVDTSTFTKISEGETILEKVQVSEYQEVYYIKVPNKLNEGFYLVQYFYDENKKLEQLWLQVTPILGHISVGKEDTVIWLNSIKDRLPVSNARIALINSPSDYFTDSEGLAKFSTPISLFDRGKKYFEITSPDNKKLILPVNPLFGMDKPKVLTRNDFWSYLYTEKSTYKPNETLYFWGLAKNRNNNNPAREVEVKLFSYDKNQFEYNKIKASKKLLTLNDGTFIGEFKLNELFLEANEYYELALLIQGVKVFESHIAVREYTKPAIKIEVTSDKKAVFVGEEVEIRGRVSFFDGTAVSYAPLSIKGKGNEILEKVVTDKNGEFIYRYTPKYREGVYYPAYEWVDVNLEQSFVGQTEGAKRRAVILVYEAKLKIEGELKQDENIMKIRSTVFDLNLDSFNSGKSSDVKSNIVKGQKLSIKVKRNWYEKVEDGTYYDFVEKITRIKYKYIIKTEDLELKELTTNNSGQIEYEVSMLNESLYEIEIVAKDKNDNATTFRKYFSYYYNKILKQDKTSSNFYIHLSKNQSIFSVGEEVEAKIFQGNKEYLDNEKNKFLFIIAKKGLLSPILKDRPIFNFVFGEEHKPNVYISAVIFTGRNYSEVKTNCDLGDCYYDSNFRFMGRIISYNESENELHFDIKTKKVKHTPGENISISVNVTKNGQPVSGVSIILVVVDQALDAIGLINKPELGKSIYRDVDHQVYYSYSTNYLFSLFEGVGGFGDGEELGVRGEFADTAYFGSSITNNNGDAFFDFKLPDNITSWLVYSLGIDNNLNFGQGMSSIIATKDFFITSQFPNTVIKGDNPSLAINSYGNVLKKNEKVSYGYTFLNKDGNKIINKGEFSEFPFKDIYIPFPQLENGTYKIRTYGKYKEYEDALLLPLNIKSSRIKFEKQENFILEEGKKINSVSIENIGDEEFVRVIITDQGKGRFYNDLRGYCYLDSNRIEKNLARIKAGEVLESWFNEKDCHLSSDDLSEFQADNGGIRKVKWGDSDIETSVWSTYAGASFFNKDKLKKYFDHFLTDAEIESSREDKLTYVYALWGLAVLGDPKLNQMIGIESKLISYREKVVLAYAFFASGQIEKARDLYYDLLAQYAYTNKPYIRIQTGKLDMDSYLLDSSYALLLASMVDQKYNEGLGLYLKDYRTLASDVILDLAEISFIDQQIASLPNEDTSFSMKTGNQLREDTLRKGRGNTFVLSKNEAENFELEIKSGKALVSINSYINNIDNLETDKRLSLSRSYRQIAGDSNNSEIDLGEVIEVKLDYKFDSEAPVGMYCVKDHIPSGFTYVDGYMLFKHIPDAIVMYEVAPNIVNACVCNLPWCFSRQNEIVYYARASAVGDYVFEPAFIQYEKDRSILQKTEKENINVGKFTD